MHIIHSSRKREVWKRPSVDLQTPELLHRMLEISLHDLERVPLSISNDLRKEYRSNHDRYPGDFTTQTQQSRSQSKPLEICSRAFHKQSPRLTSPSLSLSRLKLFSHCLRLVQGKHKDGISQAYLKPGAP